MFLHTIGHNERNTVISKNFKRSGETASRYFKSVLRAIGELRDERFHVNLNGSQISNHLKTWRTRWNTIVTLKKLSSTHFINDETRTIMLDEKNYLTRVQVCIISAHSFTSIVTITPKSETSLIKETSEMVTESSSLLCPGVYYLAPVMHVCKFLHICLVPVRTVTESRSLLTFPKNK